MISHTPPTSLLPHPERRTRRRVSRMAFLVNSSLVLVLAEGWRAGNDMNFGGVFIVGFLFFFYSDPNSNMREHISTVQI